MRATGALTGVAVVLAGLVVGAAPTAAADWHPGPGVVPAAPSHVYLESQSATEPLGNGNTFSYTLADSDILVTATGGRIDLRVEIDERSTGERWSATFQPPAGVDTVVPGRYEGLILHDPQRSPQVGSISVSGPYFCTTAEGWYEIDDVAYDDGELALLEMRFEYRCDGHALGLDGAIRWDAAANPAPPHPTRPVPPSMWSPPVGAVPPGAERSLYVEASPAPSAGAPTTYLFETPEEVAFLSAGIRPNTPDGHVMQVVHQNGIGNQWMLALREPRWAGTPTAGFYDDLPARGVDPIEGGFTATYKRDKKVCTDFTSDVAIDEIDARGGVVSDIAMRFDQACAVTTKTSYRGAARWQPTPRDGAPPTPTAVTAETGDGAATVAWSHPGGAELRRFEVVTYRDGTAVATAVVGPTERSAVVDDLLPGASYTFKVAAGADPTEDEVENVVPVVSLRSPATAPIVLGDPEPHPDPAPFATVEDLVTQQHLDFVGRPPTSTERSAAAAALRTGAPTPEEYIAAMRNRPEWGGRRAVVIRLYSAYFLRRPDGAGLDYWAGELARGASVNQVSQAFATSREFRTLYGSLPNGRFVDRVYRNVLGRPPDAAGMAYWRGRLDGGTSRGAVMTGFSESAENKARMQPTVDVILFVQGMVRRIPTAEELEGHLAFLAGGASVADLVGVVLRSQEYDARVT